MPEGDVENLDEALTAMIEKATFEWERACEPATIALWMNAIEQLIRQLHAAFRSHRKIAGRDFFEAEPEDPFSRKSSGSATLKVKRPKK
jgi:hypothetical protein